MSPAADRLQLLRLAHATDNNGRSDAATCSDARESFVDLNREFASGTQDQRLRFVAQIFTSKSFNDGKGKCQRFAGTGLSGRDNIFAQ